VSVNPSIYKFIVSQKLRYIFFIRTPLMTEMSSFDAQT